MTSKKGRNTRLTSLSSQIEYIRECLADIFWGNSKQVTVERETESETERDTDRDTH